MNPNTIDIAINQFLSPFSLMLLVIFLTPMVFGMITAWYSYLYTEKVTKEVWLHWYENEEFKKQKVTSSINYND